MLRSGAGGRQRTGRGRRAARTVYVVGAVALERERLAASLRGVADAIIQRTSITEIDLPNLIASPCVVVLAPYETQSSQLLASIRQFRAHNQGTPLLLCLPEESRMLAQLAAFARSGIDDLVLIDAPDAAQRLHSEIASRLEHAMPASLVSDVTQSIEQKVRGYCTWCDRNAYRALHVDDVADKFDENPTTVNRHLGNAGVRGLHDVIACARLLYVAYRLDTTSASIKTISKTLSFESPQALDMFVKRSTGLTPSDLKNRGAVEHVRSVIVTRLRRD